MLFCPNCGTKADDDALFCCECGTNFSEYRQSPAQAQTQEPAPEFTDATPEQPVEQAFEEPVAQAFEQPAEQAFEEPVAQTFEEPVAQAFEEPVEQNEVQNDAYESTVDLGSIPAQAYSEPQEQPAQFTQQYTPYQQQQQQQQYQPGQYQEYRQQYKPNQNPNPTPNYNSTPNYNPTPNYQYSAPQPTAPAASGVSGFNWGKRFDSRRSERLCKFVFSPMVIITAALFTLTIIFTITDAGSFLSSIIDLIIDWIGEGVREIEGYAAYYQYQRSDEIDALREISNMFTSVARIFAFIGQIPNIVVAIGLWLTLYSAIDKRRGGISTAGIVAIKVITAIKMVFSIIYVVLDVLLAASVIKGICDDYYEMKNDWLFSYLADEIYTEKMTIAVIVFSILTLVAVVNMIFYIRVHMTVKNFENIANGREWGHPSMFAAVMLFITACGQLFTAAIMGTPSSWFNAASTICFGILICMFSGTYRTILRENYQF